MSVIHLSVLHQYLLYYTNILFEWHWYLLYYTCSLFCTTLRIALLHLYTVYTSPIISLLHFSICMYHNDTMAITLHTTGTTLIHSVLHLNSCMCYTITCSNTPIYYFSDTATLCTTHINLSALHRPWMPYTCLLFVLHWYLLFYGCTRFCTTPILFVLPLYTVCMTPIQRSVIQLYTTPVTGFLLHWYLLYYTCTFLV